MKTLQFSVLVHTPVTFEPYDVPDGITVLKDDRMTFFSDEGLSLLTISIEIGRDFAAPIAATWLYDRFVRRKDSKPAKETKINERVLTFATRDEFMQVIEREIHSRE